MALGWPVIEKGWHQQAHPPGGQMHVENAVGLVAPGGLVDALREQRGAPRRAREQA
jgi:hypothetical protein